MIAVIIPFPTGLCKGGACLFSDYSNFPKKLQGSVSGGGK